MPLSRFATTANLNVRSGPGLDHEIWDTLDIGDTIEETSVAGWCPIEMEDGTIGWVSRQFLVAAPLVINTPPPVIIPSGEPAWIRWARQQLGQKEVPGPASNPVIQAWYRLTTLPEDMWTDATAWCAVFVNAAFMLNNIKTIRSAGAEEWLKFGKAAGTPQKGDVVVFEWSNGQHHVAFFLRDLGDGMIECIGGNQNDAVTITAFPEANVLGYRRAV
ncbi:hypothetical protein DFAR_3060010 [Desulfarculales bacterium]